MSFDYTTLVYDRTQSDVNSGSAKGTYNASDLNRVSECCNVIREMFLSYGYFVPETLRTNWSETDIPRRSEMDVIIRTIRQICSLVVFMEHTPEIVRTLERFGFEAANDIEKALANLGPIAENIPYTWFQSGQVESGVSYIT